MRVALVATVAAIACSCAARSSDTTSIPADFSVVSVDAGSDRFLQLGEELAVSGRVSPMLSTAVDIVEPGLYRLRVGLEDGTDPFGMNVVLPEDTEDFFPLGYADVDVDLLSPVSAENPLDVLVYVEEIHSPYPGFRVWVYDSGARPEQ